MRLELQSFFTISHISFDFNSIKVRLERGTEREISSSDIHFNSIKVRLEPSYLMTTADKNQYFNSIKVRLELFTEASSKGLREFQFHKGAIRTRFSRYNIEDFSHFNSIKVRLERREFLPSWAVRLHFNSIKVRLEPGGVGGCGGFC